VSGAQRFFPNSFVVYLPKNYEKVLKTL